MFSAVTCSLEIIYFIVISFHFYLIFSATGFKWQYNKTEFKKKNSFTLYTLCEIKSTYKERNFSACTKCNFKPCQESNETKHYHAVEGNYLGGMTA